MAQRSSFGSTRLVWHQPGRLDLGDHGDAIAGYDASVVVGDHTAALVAVYIRLELASGIYFRDDGITTGISMRSASCGRPFSTPRGNGQGL